MCYGLMRTIPKGIIIPKDVFGTEQMTQKSHIPGEAWWWQH